MKGPRPVLRVLIALVLREMATRYGRSVGGYAWAVLEPVAVLALLSAVFTQIAHRPPLGASFPFYFATGYLAFHFYADLAQKLGQSVHVNRALLAYPRVTPLDTVLARFLLQALTLMLVMTIILGAIVLVDRVPLAMDLGRLCLAIALALGLGLAVGLLNAALFVLAPGWERCFGIVNRPLFLISGVFFELESLPRDLRELLWYNPLIHLTGLMRQGFFAQYDGGHVSLAYLGTVLCAAMALAVLVFRASGRQLVEQ